MSAMASGLFSMTPQLITIDISFNKFTELPTSLCGCTALQHLICNDNSITIIDACFLDSNIWANLSFLSLYNNPSVCHRVGLYFPPSNETSSAPIMSTALPTTQTDVICNCAATTFGISYCLPLLTNSTSTIRLYTAFSWNCQAFISLMLRANGLLPFDPILQCKNSFVLVELPIFISANFIWQSSPEEIHSQFGPEFSIDAANTAIGPRAPASGNPFSCIVESANEYCFFKISFNGDATLLFKFNVSNYFARFSIRTVITIFAYTDVSSFPPYGNFPAPKYTTLNLSLMQPIAGLVPDFIVFANSDFSLPTNITYHNGSALPPNITLSPSLVRGVITTVQLSGNVSYISGSDPYVFVFNITAKENNCGEHRLAATIHITIYDCPQTNGGADVYKCNGGQCMEGVGPHDGIYTCNCSTLSPNSDPYCVNNYTLNCTELHQICSSARVGFLPALIFLAFIGCLPLAVGIFFYRRANHVRRYLKLFHIFISYRVRTDGPLAKKLCTALQNQLVDWDSAKGWQVQVKCFWDAQDITNGSDWKETFLQALEHTCLFVPIVSEAAIAPMKHIPSRSKIPDNVLLEYEVANRVCKDERMVIFPIWVGGVDTLSTVGDSRSPPTARLLDSNGNIKKFDWGSYNSSEFPDFSSPTSNVRVAETLEKIYRHQGVFLADAETLRIHVGPAGGGDDLVPIIMGVLNNKAWCNPQV